MGQSRGQRMGVVKRVLCRERLRKIPPQFNWVDHRLVQDRHICRCSAHALALYLFLVTVADVNGLSYYSDKSISKLLSMDAATLAHARQELIVASLVAYERPLYQVLSLDSPPAARREGLQQPLSLGEVLRNAMGPSK